VHAAIDVDRASRCADARRPVVCLASQKLLYHYSTFDGDWNVGESWIVWLVFVPG